MTAVERGLVLLAIFVGHWQASVFFQSFFHHRYGAHRQFSMSRAWERFFNLLAYLAQGSSYLSPRAYAILHRMHHAFSDTPEDPHSPANFRDVLRMMWATKRRYDDFAYEREAPEPRFAAATPRWPALDRLGQSWTMRLVWVAAYTAPYVVLAPSPWFYCLLPLHWVMGPVHGAIVNWCGHRYGYRNFELADLSRNTLAFDFLTAGELFQNNHHRRSMSPNFASRWFEIDPTYLAIRVLAALRVIDLDGVQRRRGLAIVPSAVTEPADVRGCPDDGEAFLF